MSWLVLLDSRWFPFIWFGAVAAVLVPYILVRRARRRRLSRIPTINYQLRGPYRGRGRR